MNWIFKWLNKYNFNKLYYIDLIIVIVINRIEKSVLHNVNEYTLVLFLFLDSFLN